MSIDSRDDANGEPLDEFYVEPWTVEVRSESLTLTDRTPPGEYFLSACVPAVIGVIIAVIAMWWGGRWSWEVRLLAYVMAGLIATGAFPFIAKGLRGRQAYLFDRRSRTVRLNDEPPGSWSDIQAIKLVQIVEMTLPNDRVGRMKLKETTYQLHLHLGPQTVVLVTSGVNASVERLGRALADFTGVPLTRG